MLFYCWFSHDIPSIILIIAFLICQPFTFKWKLSTNFHMNRSYHNYKDTQNISIAWKYKLISKREKRYLCIIKISYIYPTLTAIRLDPMRHISVVNDNRVGYSFKTWVCRLISVINGWTINILGIASSIRKTLLKCMTKESHLKSKIILILYSYSINDNYL